MPLLRRGFSLCPAPPVNVNDAVDELAEGGLVADVSGAEGLAADLGAGSAIDRAMGACVPPVLHRGRSQTFHLLAWPSAETSWLLPSSSWCGSRGKPSTPSLTGSAVAPPAPRRVCAATTSSCGRASWSRWAFTASELSRIGAELFARRQGVEIDRLCRAPPQDGEPVARVTSTNRSA